MDKYSIAAMQRCIQKLLGKNKQRAQQHTHLVTRNATQLLELHNQ